jgi:hypothetical protein
MIARLAKLAASGSVWGKALLWPFTHFRLLIEYALIAALVACGGLLLYNRTRLAQQETAITGLQGDLKYNRSELDQQVQINAGQDLAIQDLQDLRKKDARALVGLQGDLTDDRARAKSLRSKLDQLEANNAQAREILDVLVPANVGCVLDHRPCETDDGNADADSQGKAWRRVVAPVRPPGANPNAPSPGHSGKS